MFPEYKTIQKAERYYGTLQVSPTLSINQRVIMSLCDMMISIWNEWQEDTRHYQPSQATHRAYLEKIEAGRLKLDKSAVEYDTAKRVIKDCKQYINLVVLYRVQHRRKSRLF